MNGTADAIPRWLEHQRSLDQGSAPDFVARLPRVAPPRGASRLVWVAALLLAAARATATLAFLFTR
jgi:hypothetical protein